jgi:FkbM family methyltransferase
VNGGYEAETVRLLLRLLEASPGYLLDIGANVGLIAIPAARMSNRKVVAIEAVPDNAAALAHNISMNSLGDSIRVIPMGVGEVQAKVDIQVEGDLKDGQGTGSANILPNGSTYQCERIQIEVTTLDLLLSEKRIDATCGVVKIDTDGYDLKVLQGGTTFLERSRPIVFGEFAAPCLAWHGQTVDDVKQFAASHDYVAWAADGHGSSLFRPEADRATFVQDLLLVPSEKVSQLGWCLAPPSH